MKQFNGIKVLCFWSEADILPKYFHWSFSGTVFLKKMIWKNKMSVSSLGKKI